MIEQFAHKFAPRLVFHLMCVLVALIGLGLPPGTAHAGPYQDPPLPCSSSPNTTKPSTQCIRAEAYSGMKAHLDANSQPNTGCEWARGWGSIFISGSVFYEPYMQRYYATITCANTYNPAQTTSVLPVRFMWNQQCPTGTTWDNLSNTCRDPLQCAQGACRGLNLAKSLGPECRASTSGLSPKTDCGNPINVATGNKYQREVDLEGVAALVFVRHYNSDPIARSDAFLGPHWTHSFSRRVEHLAATPSAPETVNVLRAEGNQFSFQLINGQWKPDADVFASLARIDGPAGALVGWTYTPNDGREVEKYDALGRLVQIETAQGLRFMLTYNNGVVANNDDDLRLTRVESQGRSLNFSYTTEGRLGSLIDAAGQTYEYGYDALGRLESTTFPGGGQRLYHYNEAVYTDGADLPLALTGVTREDGIRFATFRYMADGRAVSTEHAGSVEKFSATYNPDGSSQISTPAGKTEVRAFIAILGLPKATSVQDQCSGCATRTATYAYDVNGRADALTDPTGTVTDYSFDTRGLLTQTAESNNKSATKRVTQTEWNAYFRVPIEQRIYNSANTLVRKQTWTYNSRGQVLTHSINAP